MANALLFLAGLAALVGGAELLVRGAGKLALSLGISPLVVGLTVVAFGTSSPELAVSVQSAWEGRTDLAVGNVIGGNVFNVLFILGLSAVLAALVVSRQVVRQEVPMMVGASLLLVLLPFAAGAIALAMALNLVRLARGPGPADRILALDTLHQRDRDARAARHRLRHLRLLRGRSGGRAAGVHRHGRALQARGAGGRGRTSALASFADAAAALELVAWALFALVGSWARGGS